jgi:hypothetical protein
MAELDKGQVKVKIEDNDNIHMGMIEESDRIENVDRECSKSIRSSPKRPVISNKIMMLQGW